MVSTVSFVSPCNSFSGCSKAYNPNSWWPLTQNQQIWQAVPEGCLHQLRLGSGNPGNSITSARHDYLLIFDIPIYTLLHTNYYTLPIVMLRFFFVPPFHGTSILRIGLLQKKTYWNHTCCIRNSSSRFMLFYEIYYIFCIWLRPTCTICNLSWPQCCSPFCLQKNKSFIKILPKSSHLVVVWLKSTFHTHVFQKNQRKSKGIGCLLLFMAPLALCTSMSQRGDAVAHGRAHEGNWQKRSSPHGCMEAYGKASQVATEIPPNKISA